MGNELRPLGEIDYRQLAIAAFKFERAFMVEVSQIERQALRAFYGEVRIELMRMGVELERFRRAEGRFPSRLSELVPSYLSSLPLDLMTGEPLRYRLKGDGTPLLYSLGENQEDDEGWGAQRQEWLDWVWQMTPTDGQGESSWQWGQK